jgi:integrase
LKPPKTKKSRKPIYLPLSLYGDLNQLKAVSKDPSPTGWIFPSERKRRRRFEDGEIEASAALMPLDYHNWVNRNLKPVADELGIRVNCQIMRRTFATLANDAGGDLKDIQTMLRHARSATTADIYIQPIPRACGNQWKPWIGFSVTAPRHPNRRRTIAVCTDTPHCDIAAISAPALVSDVPER